jgi:Fur family ferric uptake transcriptional regulator
MSLPQKQFELYVKRLGGRLTKARTEILREIYNRHDHFDAEEIYIALKRKGLDVSRASVYRAIPMFIDTGLILQVVYTDKHKHYEHVMGHEHHEHMICRKCGKIIEFEDAALERALKKACRDKGFNLATHKIEAQGTCGKCTGNSKN